MDPIILLHIVELHSGDWSLALHHGGEAPAEGLLTHDEVVALQTRIRALASPIKGLLTPERAHLWAERERQTGQALAAALVSRQAIWSALCRHLGAIWARAEIAVLAISASGPVARALPWELLAEGPALPPLISTRPFVVARLMAGLAPPPRVAHRLRLVLWAFDPTDNVVRSAVRRFAALGDRHRARAIVVEGPALAQVAPPQEGEADLVVMVAHGRADEERFWLRLAGGSTSATEPAHALTTLFAGALLVVLAICEADALVPELTDGLAGRIMLAGAPAALAPRHPWLDLAFDALLEGVVPSLAGGDAVATAVRAGLARVAALQTPHPTTRPSSLSFCLADRHAAQLRLRTTPWPGAPPAPEGARLLAQAHARARRAGQGFLGVEHLALAQVDLDGGGASTGRVRRVLLGERARVEAELSLWTSFRRADEPALSPRLARLANCLPSGWHADALWEALMHDPGVPIRGLDAPSSPTTAGTRLDTWSASTTHAPSVPAEGTRLFLEVQGGPEDGRRVPLDPGRALGRWTPQGHPQDHLLYQGTAVGDAHLSRMALALRGGRTIIVEQRHARLTRRGDVPRAIAGQVTLELGDVLQIGDVTRVILLAEHPNAQV